MRNVFLVAVAAFLLSINAYASANRFEYIVNALNTTKSNTENRSKFLHEQLSSTWQQATEAGLDLSPYEHALDPTQILDLPKFLFYYMSLCAVKSKYQDNFIEPDIIALQDFFLNATNLFAYESLKAQGCTHDHYQRLPMLEQNDDIMVYPIFGKTAKDVDFTLEEINYMLANRILLVGCTIECVKAHGSSFSPLDFALHDLIHAYAWFIRLCSKECGDYEYMSKMLHVHTKLYQKHVGKYKEQLALFLMSHEFPPNFLHGDLSDDENDWMIAFFNKANQSINRFFDFSCGALVSISESKIERRYTTHSDLMPLLVAAGYDDIEQPLEIDYSYKKRFMLAMVKRIGSLCDWFQKQNVTPVLK